MIAYGAIIAAFLLCTGIWLAAWAVVAAFRRFEREAGARWMDGDS